MGARIVKRYTTWFSEVVSLKSTNRNRPEWFFAIRGFMKFIIRRPAFKFEGETFEENGEPFILLSNHVGAQAPLRYELYLNVPFRFWGTYEMIGGMKSAYHYLAEVFLLRKKHFPAFWAKTVAFVICPFVNLFYRGLRMIPTYTDGRFRLTLAESAEALGNGENLIIFPEDSSDGYHDELKSFFPGFVALAQILRNRGRDVPIFCSYYRKKDHTIIVSEPLRFSEISEINPDKYQIASLLCEKTNRLAGR